MSNPTALAFPSVWSPEDREAQHHREAKRARTWIGGLHALVEPLRTANDPEVRKNLAGAIDGLAYALDVAVGYIAQETAD